MNLFEDEVAQLEQRVRAHPAGSTVFYGSSTIRLWPDLNAHFPTIDALNLGFGGSTLAACAWHFERLVVPAHPRALILYAGDNDLGEGQSPEAVYLFFCALMEKKERFLPDVPLSFISIKPSPARWSLIESIRAANRAIATEIKRLPHCSFLDLSAAMLTESGQPRPELYEDDALHLNAAGYAVWRTELARHLFNGERAKE
jgi:lysophospholipase L1-like esterase